MKKIKNGVAIVLVLACTMGFVQATDWYLFESKDFSVEFPKKPAPSTQTVNTAVGELKLDIFMCETSKDGDDNLLYGLITSDYPDSVINSDKVEKLEAFFRGSIDGAVKNVNGKLLSEKVIDIDGFPGREIKVDFQNGMAVIRMQMFLVHNKMIFLQTIAETAKESNDSALKFYKSFKLKK